MIYLTGIQALNLPCKLDTCGDWHCSGLRWDVLNLRDTKDTLFGDYEIELNKTIPEHTEQYNVANHIRALLDLIEGGNFSAAQGMKNDFICNDAYNEEIFSMVYKLCSKENWDKIYDFMHKEYKRSWRSWMNGKENI